MPESRRAFMLATARAAGVAGPAFGLLAGTETLARTEENDVAILSAALLLEHHAIALYGYGLGRGLFPPGLRAYATEFRGDHQGHRDTQIAIMEERGAGAPAARDDYDFSHAPAGDDFVRLALEIEVAAQRAYTDADQPHPHRRLPPVRGLHPRRRGAAHDGVAARARPPDLLIPGR